MAWLQALVWTPLRALQWWLQLSAVVCKVKQKSVCWSLAPSPFRRSNPQQNRRQAKTRPDKTRQTYTPLTFQINILLVQL